MLTANPPSIFRLAALACLLAGGAAAEGAFVDVTERLGLAYHVPPPADDAIDGDIYFRTEDGGLALVDIDRDGRLELYVAHGAGETGRLFGWNGERFLRLADNRGIRPAAMDGGGYFLDLDRDGRAEFISIQKAGVQIFRQNEQGGFEDAGERFGIPRHRHATSLAAGDYDGDGDLDLVFGHWMRVWSGQRPPAHALWRNDGKGRFEDASHLLEIRPGILPDSILGYEFSFTPIFSDIDGDGDPDLLLAGDFGTSQVLRNEAGAAFRDIGGAVIDDENGMGAAAGDYDRDGDIDWFVTSIYDPDGSSTFGSTGNRLYRNLGDGRFENATGPAGVRDGGWGWGACWADFDNDGHADLFLTNGWPHDLADSGPGDAEREGEFAVDPSRLFMSDGAGGFTERAAELGIRHTGQGRGAVCADHDGDGRVDIFIANHAAAPTVYANALDNDNRWLAIALAGGPDNPAGIGARVTVRSASGSQLQEMRLGGSYLSQAPPVLHFGLGADEAASVEVRWPDGQATRLDRVALDRRLTIRAPPPEGVMLSVARGQGSGAKRPGEAVAIRAEPARGHYRFSHWTGEGGVRFQDARAPETVAIIPDGPAMAFAHFLPGPAAGVSVARRWIELLLQAIRDDFARPTVHARNLFHLSAAMYDAWAAWSDTARPWRFGEAEAPCGTPPAGGEVRRLREEAVSHAAWRLIRHRFRTSPGALATARNADTLMAALGHDTEARSAAARFGACLGRFYIERGLEDGANEAEDYRSLAYKPVNESLWPEEPGNPTMEHPDRWQPLALTESVDQAGFSVGEEPPFVTPEWGRVTPFALAPEDRRVRERDGASFTVYDDPGPPPGLRGPLPAHYRWGFGLVVRWSAQLSPEDGVQLDIAPSGIGNLGALPRAFRDYPEFYRNGALGPGHAVNPATGRPYRPQLAARGDYARVLAEFWADGPESETPPGHWFLILNAVRDHALFEPRFAGRGPALDPLEWDAKAYFALGGALHDAAIAAWSIKGWYDYVRPISALRVMAERGQSSDPALPSFSADGIALEEGLIELIQAGDSLAGEYGDHVGKIKLRAWRGPQFVRDPDRDVAGVGWILAENWWPYQRPSFVTPPFAGYVSGHSTFSRAAAEVLTALTGDAFFPGGMSDFRIPADDFLTFERGPSRPMVLQWATYRDAADQCSLSRIWGGIHPPADDIPGRLIGERIGRNAFRLAASLFSPN